MIKKFKAFIFAIATINIQLQCGDILIIKNKFPQITKIRILSQNQGQQLRERDIALFPGESRTIYLEGHDDRFIGYQTETYRIIYQQNQNFLHYFLRLEPNSQNYLNAIKLK